MVRVFRDVGKLKIVQYIQWKPTASVSLLSICYYRSNRNDVKVDLFIHTIFSHDGCVMSLSQWVASMTAVTGIWTTVFQFQYHDACANMLLLILQLKSEHTN